MPKLVNILLTSLALSGFIFIGLPHFPAHFAGYFIFLTLLATPFVVLLVLVEIALLLWTKSRWRWFMAVIIIGCLGVLQNHWIRPHSTQPAAHSLRVLSWNVTNFHIHQDTLQKAATFIRHEHIEHQTVKAFHIFARTVQVMYRIGAALQLKRLGYKFHKVDLSRSGMKPLS